MFYEFAIKITKDTAESSPKTQYLKVAHGIVQRIDIQFPVGCAGLAHCRLDYHRLLTFPADRTKNISSDGFIISIEGPYELFTPPYRFKATLWNTDDTYDHTVTIRVDMVESEAAIRLAKILTGLTGLLKLMGIKT